MCAFLQLMSTFSVLMEKGTKVRPAMEILKAGLPTEVYRSEIVEKINDVHRSLVTLFQVLIESDLCSTEGAVLSVLSWPGRSKRVETKYRDRSVVL